MSKSFDWDVFLSHSSIDKLRVARLAERLTAAGFRVWFAPTSIAHGHDVFTEIEDGLERSRVLILCMTKAAFESEWVRPERNTATFRDPGNLGRRFLPVKFEDCQIPETLRRLQFIDWRHESEAAWQQLLTALRSETGPLPEVPPGIMEPVRPLHPGSGKKRRARSSRSLRRTHSCVSVTSAE